MSKQRIINRLQQLYRLLEFGIFLVADVEEVGWEIERLEAELCEAIDEEVIREGASGSEA